MLSCVLGALAAAVFSASAGDASGLDRSDITLTNLSGGLDTHIILGNGDLLAFVEERDGYLVIGTSKNDVWDVRLDTSNDPPLAPLADFEAMASQSAEALRQLVKTHAHPNDSYQGHPYPCPRMTAEWRIPLEGKKIRKATLTLRTATARIEFEDGGGVQCAVLATRNVLLVQLFGEIALPMPELMPILDPEVIDAPTMDRATPPAWLEQKLPDDVDVAGIAFAVATMQNSGAHVMGQATSLESESPRDAAFALCQSALETPVDALWQEHRNWWEAFWQRSGVALEDAELEQIWYQQVYFTGAAIRPGKASPGLFAPLTSNRPAWHGDYHTNYNIQQTYWSVFPTNHVEFDEPYERLIAEYLPRAEWLAGKLYGVEGAFYPHVIMFREPADPELCKATNNRQYVHAEWAYTLGVTAFTVQNLWWRYRYAPDKAFLETVAYPVLSETARFYANVLAQYRGDDGYSRPPTVSPEHWGWTVNLEKNKNSTFDTAIIAFNLKAAIEAATTLGVDDDYVKTWNEALTWLPPYPTYGAVDPIIVDVESAEPIEYNIPIPSTVVFPGEQVTCFSPETERAIFARTIAGMRSNGNNDLVINAIARARLDMPDAFDYLKREAMARRRPNGTLSLNRLIPEQKFNAFGHYTEMYGAAAAVSELLLQSVDGVIRVFPGWPRGKTASFDTLRAVGGFLVSADFDGENVTSITIHSTAGGTCRIHSPWAKIVCGSEVYVPDEGGIVSIPTQKGEDYSLDSPPG